MRKYVFVISGGFTGAILRDIVENIGFSCGFSAFPLNTLVINSIGAFLLAMILTLSFEFRAFDADLRLGLTTGLLGGFTTFSTLCKEAVTLLGAGHYVTALVYLLISTLLGLAAVYFGIVVTRKIGNFVSNRDNELDMMKANMIEADIVEDERM